MGKLRGLMWEPSKEKGTTATSNTKLAAALVNWYFGRVNDFVEFDEMILDKSHIHELEIFGFVEEFTEDIDKIIVLINANGGILLKLDLLET